jgi:chromate transporter
MNVATKLYLDIFISFLKPGVMTFGGGPSTIPLLQSEMVDARGWLTIQEFTDSLAISNALPGPIATKMSAVIGYKVGGWMGAVVGTLATVLPTAIAVIVLFSIYQKYKEATWMMGMMKAVRPVVVILVAQTVWVMAKSSFPDLLTYVIAGGTVLALFVFKVNPALLILGSLIFGGFFIKG